MQEIYSIPALASLIEKKEGEMRRKTDAQK